MVGIKKLYITVAACICAAAVALLIVLPGQAQALEVERWSARANQDGGNDIMGATPTRITFQGQADEGESISELTLYMPEGSYITSEDSDPDSEKELDAEQVTVTILSGLDRLAVESEVSIEGDTGIRIEFPDNTPEGTMVQIEINNISLPIDGGSFELEGTYITSDGKEHSLPPSRSPIEVVGLSTAEKISVWLGEQEWVQWWNSIKFLHLFLDPTIAVKSIPSVFTGWLLALGLVVLSFPLSIPLGLFWSFLRMSKNRFIRALGSLYINVVRGTPLFLQIYIAFFGLPLLGISLDNFTLGICVLVMNSSAYLAEIFRAGIQSIDKGQFEAARSLGMTRARTMFSVIIPQTFRRVIPTMTSEFILMYKDTSLLAAVGVMEIMMFSKQITASTGNVTPYIVAAGFYLVVTLPLAKLINVLEDRMAERQSGTVKKNHKKEATEA